MYQFYAYNFLPSAPLKELIPSQLWVDDMNVVTSIHGYSIFGKEVIRSHSIYSEPSIFSQFNAIAILLLLCSKGSFSKVYFFSSIIILAAGLVCSLSGTGLIILIIGGIYLFVSSKNKITLSLMAVPLCVIFLILLLNGRGDLFSYFAGRAFEISRTDTSYTSGYYRFVLPFQFGFNHLLGFGVGNDDIALLSINAYESTISNGFGKVFTELGIVGLIMIVAFFLIGYPKGRNKRHIKLFLIVTITLNIVGTFMAPMFWCFAVPYICLTQTRNDYLRP